MAELEGHPDQVDLSPLKHLDRKAASRYSASTSALLHWFHAFNGDNPHAERVKAFNFMLAYQISRPAYFAAIADGEVDPTDYDEGFPPWSRLWSHDHQAALADAFDRRTGKAVPLQSWRHMLTCRRYHLHQNLSSGMASSSTGAKPAGAFRRSDRHGIYWKRGKSLGRTVLPWRSSGSAKSNIVIIQKAVRVVSSLIEAATAYGMEKLAKEARISRQQLHTILSASTKPKRGTIIRLCRAVKLLTRAAQTTKHLASACKL